TAVMPVRDPRTRSEHAQQAALESLKWDSMVKIVPPATSASATRPHVGLNCRDTWWLPEDKGGGFLVYPLFHLGMCLADVQGPDDDVAVVTVPRHVRNYMQ